MSLHYKIDRFVKANSLKPADVVVVEKRGFRILDHYVVYLGMNHRGQHAFTANMMGDGVRLLSQAELALIGVKYIPIRIRRFQGDNRERRAAVIRAKDDLGKGYNFIINNCEHHANRTQYNQNFSRQSNIGLGIVAGAALLGLLGWAFSGSDDEEQHEI